MVYIEQCLHAALCFCSVVVILRECPTSSLADADDIIASHLPRWKNLRKVQVHYMNPVPILVVVGSCGKLNEVVIKNPENCTVGFPELYCTGPHRVMLLGGPTTLVQCVRLLRWEDISTKCYH